MIFLNDRRALSSKTIRTNAINPNYFAQSVLEIRQRLNQDLENLDSKSPLAQSLRELQLACREILDILQFCVTEGFRQSDWRPMVELALKQFKFIFATHLSEIAKTYDEKLATGIAENIKIPFYHDKPPDDEGYEELEYCLNRFEKYFDEHKTTK